MQYYLDQLLGVLKGPLKQFKQIFCFPEKEDNMASIITNTNPNSINSMLAKATRLTTEKLLALSLEF